MSTIPTIKSINQLFKNLIYGGGYDGYQGILKSIDFDGKSIEHLCHWNNDYPTRIGLAKMDTFELQLICWEEGQEIPIHDHEFVDSWIYVLEGELLEEEYKSSGAGSPPMIFRSSKLNKGEFTFASDSIGLHKLMNTNKGRSITVHVYTGILEKWHIYNEKNGQRSEEVINCDFEYDIETH
jgi:predicted metal-dependent enzyme (double-stranded beta helix superfamily)